MVTGFFGKLLDNVSSERRHKQVIEQAAEHHQENRVSDAVDRFAEHLLATNFNATENRRFLDIGARLWEVGKLNDAY